MITTIKLEIINNNPTIGFDVLGLRKFTIGVDDKDSDKFKISTESIGKNDRITIDKSGNITLSGNLTADGDIILNKTNITVNSTDNSSNITMTANKNDQDLTISTAGNYDTSLILSSSGTSATDAIYINAQSGSISIQAGSEKEVIFNNSQANADVRIKGNTISNIFFADASEPKKYIKVY